MVEHEFKREKKEALPVLAVCYDFDRTLSPTDMQAQGFIQETGRDVSAFWKASNHLAEEHEMDQNLAYMLKMKESAEGNILFTREKLKGYGRSVELFPGVERWFDRICRFGGKNGVIVEHYIISSGLKEMIEGTRIYPKFKKVYASSFYYSDSGVAVWPAQVVNYTNKTQFLFRIHKGVLDINDPAVNDYFPPERIRIPFSNIVYIGDSDTDIPCMKLVNAYGGHAIGVFNPKTGDKTKVYKMLREKRINYFAPADYQSGTQLDEIVKGIILETASSEALKRICYECRRETVEAGKKIDEPRRIRQEMIVQLENSLNFKQTHQIISEMERVNGWNPDEIEAIFTLAAKNSQVRSILRDPAVFPFFQRLLALAGTGDIASPGIREIRRVLEE